MTVLLNHLNNTFTTAANVLPIFSKKALASAFVGTLGIIHAIALKNDTYIKSALLWTAASCVAAYFTRHKNVQLVTGRVDHPSRKLTSQEFNSQVGALYESRKTSLRTTHSQQKQFYTLVLASLLFSPEEKAKLTLAHKCLEALRPYMERSSYLAVKFDKTRTIPTNAPLPSGIANLRDAFRLQALEELEKDDPLARNPDRLASTKKWVFEAIENGILEDPAVRINWSKKRGKSESFRCGEDDARLYFSIKFSHKPVGTDYRFHWVKPMHSLLMGGSKVAGRLATVSDIVKHREAIRKEATEELQNALRSPESIKEAKKWIFKAIEKGILENPKVHLDLRKERGSPDNYRGGQDDAILYFSRKFFNDPKLNASYAFYGLRPIHSPFPNIRSTMNIRMPYWI